MCEKIHREKNRCARPEKLVPGISLSKKDITVPAQ